MGLFSRSEKVCSFANAKKLLQTKKYENYIAEPVVGKEGMYRLVPVIKPHQIEQQVKSKNIIEERQKFKNELTGNGAYQNIEAPKNYNNYQAAKGYKKQKFMSFGR